MPLPPEQDPLRRRSPLRPSELAAELSSVPPAGLTPGALAAELVAEDDDRALLDAVAAQENAARDPFARGAYSAASGMTAGAYAHEANQAAAAGDAVRAGVLRQQAEDYAGYAAREAPAIRSLRDVRGLGDLATLTAGHLGSAAVSMAPGLAAGLVTRGRAAPGLSSYAGALVPSYMLERNEAALTQATDPELWAKPVEERMALAQRKGLAGGLLEAAVPAMLARGVARPGVSPLRTLGVAAGEEAATETGQEAVGILAEETLRRGSLEAALPALNDDPMRLVDAAYAGLVGGGGMALPTAATQAAANAVVAARDKSKALAEQSLDKGGELAGQAQDLRTRMRGWADAVLAEGAPDAVVVDALNREEGPPSPLVTPLDEAPLDAALQAAVERADPVGIREAMAAREQAQQTLRQRTAERLLQDPDTPPPLRELADRVLRGEASLMEQTQLLGEAHGEQVGRQARWYAARGVRALDELTSAATKSSKRLWTWARSKFNEQTPEGADPEAPARTQALFKALRPELQQAPEVAQRLVPLQRLLSTLDTALTSGPPDRETYRTLQRLSPVLDWFTAPDQVLPERVRPIWEAATRAERDAMQDDSWLVGSMLAPFAKQATPEARRAIGRIVDRYATLRQEPDRAEEALLRRAFGPQGVQAVRMHYALQVPLAPARAGAEEAAEDGEELRYVAEDAADAADAVDDGDESVRAAAEADAGAVDPRRRAIEERERLGKLTYEFADPEGVRPFVAPRSVVTRRGPRSRLLLDVRARNATQRDQYARPVTLRQLAEERALSEAQVQRHVQAALDHHAKLSKQEQARGQTPSRARLEEREFLDAVLEQTQYDPAKPLAEQPAVTEALLDHLMVVRSEARDFLGDTGARAPELYRAGRVGVARARKIDPRKGGEHLRDQALLRGSFFTVWRKIGETERPLTLSAATLRRAQRDGQTQSTNEPGPQFRVRQFQDALGDLVMSDDRITRIDIPDDVVIDLESGQRLTRDEVLRARAMAAAQEAAQEDAEKRSAAQKAAEKRSAARAAAAAAVREEMAVGAAHARGTVAQADARRVSQLTGAYQLGQLQAEIDLLLDEYAEQLSGGLAAPSYPTPAEPRRSPAQARASRLHDPQAQALAPRSTQRRHDPDTVDRLREQLDDALQALRTLLDERRRALAMASDQGLYVDRVRAELTAPAARRRLRELLGPDKDQWGAVDAFVAAQPVSLPLRLAAQLRLEKARVKAAKGKARAELAPQTRAVRDEAMRTLEHAQETLFAVERDHGLGDSTLIDAPPDLQTGPVGRDLPRTRDNVDRVDDARSQVREFDDFGGALRENRDDLAPPPAKDRAGQAQRARDSLLAEEREQARWVGRAVLAYIEDGALPALRDPALQRRALEVVQQYINASRGERGRIHQRWATMMGMSDAALEASLRRRQAQPKPVGVRTTQPPSSELTPEERAERAQRLAEFERYLASDEARAAEARRAEERAKKARAEQKKAAERQAEIAEFNRRQAELNAQLGVAPPAPPADSPSTTRGGGRIEGEALAALKARNAVLEGAARVHDQAKGVPPPRVKFNLEYGLLELNGSGESSASLEAIGRLAEERLRGRIRLLIDRDGSVRELFGVDAVDTVAGPGQVIVQKGIGRDEWTILSQGRDVSDALARGRLNAARFHHRFSEQNAARHGAPIGPELEQKIRAELKRIAGLEDKQVLFVDPEELGGASGSYTPAQRAIRIAITALNPLGVAYHEALHDFIAGLEQFAGGRELRNQLLRAREMPHVVAQMKTLLRGHERALAQIESDPEEFLAYLFQFWAVGKYTGSPVIKLSNGKLEGALARLAAWIRGLLGVVGRDEYIEQVFEAVYSGKFADRNIVAEVIADLKIDTLETKIARLAGPLAEVYDKLMLTATDRLRALGTAATDELADLFATEAGRERGGLRFLDRRARMAAKFDNQRAQLLSNATAVEQREALRNLQSMRAPRTALERGVRALLDALHTYMKEAGVKTYDPETKEWKDLGFVENYFPRIWDRAKILQRKDKFRTLLMQHGEMTPESADKVIEALTRGESPELADNEWHVGYTAFTPQVQGRVLNFISPANAHLFAEFQSDDLSEVLTAYIYRAVHRAEFARDFGNDGARLQTLLDEAAKTLPPEQVAAAANAVKALVGTLGANINPRLKDLYSAAILAQNVILLPLTLFSQFIDALGVGLRAQAPEEAWQAFKRGVRDLIRAIRRRQEPDYDTEMAKTLGLIDEQNMLEAMGQAHAGAFMSAWGRRLNQKFFRLNGMESWNRSMRVSAMVAGERFIIRERQNGRYMRELGLDVNDPAIMVMPSGRLAMTAEQMQMLGASPEEARAREAKIQEAVFRFVDTAVLRPNAAQRPVWASDPHWMLIFHLKQFAFSFQKTILARVYNEYTHGKHMPMAILAAYVPVTIASGALKGLLTGNPIGDGSLADLLNYGVMRSGILGTQAFSADALSDLERGLLPGTSLLGPSVEHAWMASRFLVGDPEVDAGRLLDRSVPFARYF